MWGILVFVSWLVKKMPLITGGGIPQTRGVINGRVAYKHPFIELVSKFVGGILALSTGLSLGREGPSVQIGSYVGCLVSKWGRVLAGERKQLLAAGAGAGLAAAFAAPLASSLLVIESIERFDAPKTAITTILAGVVAGGVASWIFPINPYFHIDAIVPGMTFGDQVKLFLLLAYISICRSSPLGWRKRRKRRSYGFWLVGVLPCSSLITGSLYRLISGEDVLGMSSICFIISPGLTVTCFWGIICGIMIGRQERSLG